MTTLHLHYNTLKHVLKLFDIGKSCKFSKNGIFNIDMFHEHTEQCEHAKILFTKKVDITHIAIILPTDICEIINQYCNEIISLHTNVRYANNYIRFQFENSAFVINLETRKRNPGKYYYNIRFWTSCDVLQIIEPTRVFKEHEDDEIDNNDTRSIMNAFMAKKYGKTNYFDCVQQSTSYSSDNDTFSNLICLTDRRFLLGLKIYDCKKFTYLIVMIKCILKGMNKYYAVKN